MERELAVYTHIYMKMKDGETQEAAIERFIETIESVGLEWLTITEDDVHIKMNGLTIFFTAKTCQFF